jgi:fibronectin type 3 domain-containing protein
MKKFTFALIVTVSVVAFAFLGACKFHDDEPPEAPAGVTASALSSTSIAISWNSVSGAAKYKIYRSPNNGAYLEIGESTTLSYTDTGLTPATSYHYKVTAVDDNGNESSQSDLGYTATKSNDNSLSAPTGVAASALSSTSIAVSWNNVIGAVKYKIYRSNSSDGAYLEIGESTTLSYTDTVSPGTYYYKVTAIDAGGNESNKSTADDAVTNGNLTLSAPTGVAASALSSTSIAISWNSVSGAAKYKIYRSSSSDGAYLEAGESTTLSYTDTGLTPATFYYYRVTAIDASENESRKSVFGFAITKTATANKPSEPLGVTATAESSSSISVSWNAVTGTSKYKVYRATSLSGAYVGIGETIDTWYTDTGLEAATKYYYEVSAVDSSGTESDKSLWDVATTKSEASNNLLASLSVAVTDASK